MNRNPSTRRQLQRMHALARYWERYRVELTNYDYLVLCRRIFRFLGDPKTPGVWHAGRLDYYFLRVGPSFVLAVWDQKTLQIATFPPAWLPTESRPRVESPRDSSDVQRSG